VATSATYARSPDPKKAASVTPKAANTTFKAASSSIVFISGGVPGHTRLGYGDFGGVDLGDGGDSSLSGNSLRGFSDGGGGGGRGGNDGGGGLGDSGLGGIFSDPLNSPRLSSLPRVCARPSSTSHVGSGGSGGSGSDLPPAFAATFSPLPPSDTTPFSSSFASSTGSSSSSSSSVPSPQTPSTTSQNKVATTYVDNVGDDKSEEGGSSDVMDVPPRQQCDGNNESGAPPPSTNIAFASSSSPFNSSSAAADNYKDSSSSSAAAADDDDDEGEGREYKLDGSYSDEGEDADGESDEYDDGEDAGSAYEGDSTPAPAKKRTKTGNASSAAGPAASLFTFSSFASESAKPAKKGKPPRPRPPSALKASASKRSKTGSASFAAASANLNSAFSSSSKIKISDARCHPHARDVKLVLGTYSRNKVELAALIGGKISEVNQSTRTLVLTKIKKEIGAAEETYGETISHVVIVATQSHSTGENKMTPTCYLLKGLIESSAELPGLVSVKVVTLVTTIEYPAQTFRAVQTSEEITVTTATIAARINAEPVVQAVTRTEKTLVLLVDNVVGTGCTICAAAATVNKALARAKLSDNTCVTMLALTCTAMHSNLTHQRPSLTEKQLSTPLPDGVDMPLVDAATEKVRKMLDQFPFLKVVDDPVRLPITRQLISRLSHEVLRQFFIENPASRNFLGLDVDGQSLLGIPGGEHDKPGGTYARFLRGEIVYVKKQLAKINKLKETSMNAKRAATEWLGQCDLLQVPQPGTPPLFVSAAYAGKNGATTAKTRHDQEDKPDGGGTALCYLFPKLTGMKFDDRIFFPSSTVSAVATVLDIPHADVNGTAEVLTEAFTGGMFNCANTGTSFGDLGLRINMIVNSLLVQKYGGAVVGAWSKKEHKELSKKLRSSLLACDVMADDVGAMKVIRHTTESDEMAARLTLDELLSKLCVDAINTHYLDEEGRPTMKRKGATKLFTGGAAAKGESVIEVFEHLSIVSDCKWRPGATAH